MTRAADGWKPAQRPDALLVAFTIVPTHLLAFGVLWLPPTLGRLALTLAAFLVVTTSYLMVYHRYLSHRSFEFTHPVFMRFFATLGALNGSGPIWWAAAHRLHHRFSDREGDPHDASVGLWYAHHRWMLFLDPRFDLGGARARAYYSLAPDVAKDPYLRVLDRGAFALVYLWWGALYALGGAALALYGGVLPSLFVLHSVYAVNSLCHGWGYRNFASRDGSTNNLWLLPLCLGENFHNNHHAMPWSARHGFHRWWELDLVYLELRVLEVLGLVRDLKVPGAEGESDPQFPISERARGR